MEGTIPIRTPDPEKKPPKYRDRRGYISPQKAAKRAEREAAQEKASVNESKIPFMKGGRVLSVEEAKTLSGPFQAAMQDYFQYADQYLWNRLEKAGKSNGQKPIWTKWDDEELAAFTRTMMKLGQHNTFAATAVRGISESREYFTTAVLFFGFMEAATETAVILEQTRPPKKERGRRIA